MANKHGLIRTIYLYIFALLGLVLLVIGTVRFIDMGLKAFIFTKAEEPERIQQRYIYSPLAIPAEKLNQYQESDQITEEEKAVLKDFLDNYKKQQEEESKIDYLASRRQRDASTNLALILTGLPLYFYHWRIIRRETKEKEA